MSPRRVAVACAAVATVASALTVGAEIAARDWKASALVRIAESDRLADEVTKWDPGFAFAPEADHYDGLFNYTIALDPLATGPYHDLIDQPAYRYGHPGYGWAARLLALGRPEALPAALIAVNLI